MDNHEDTYYTLLDMASISKEGLMEEFLLDLKGYFPDVFEDLKYQLTKIENTKKLAALFKDVNSM